MKTNKYYQVQKILAELVYDDCYEPDIATAKLLSKYYFLGESMKKIARDFNTTFFVIQARIYTLSAKLLEIYKEQYE